jgi:hypothetical protein
MSNRIPPKKNPDEGKGSGIRSPKKGERKAEWAKKDSY